MGEKTATPEAGETEGEGKRSEQLKQKLAQQIQSAQTKLEELRNDVASLRDEDREALRQKSEEIHKRVDEQKDRARQMRADIEKWSKEKSSHTREAVASWRQRRELKKLESRAERAEEYAMQAVVIAALDFDEAEQAVLDALTARYDAEVGAAT